MDKKFVCTPEKRKQEVTDLLKELNLPYEFVEENKIKIFGEHHIYGEFLSTGHVYLEKENRKLRRMVHKWTCGGMEAITSYLKQHATNHQCVNSKMP